MKGKQKRLSFTDMVVLVVAALSPALAFYLTYGKAKDWPPKQV